MATFSWILRRNGWIPPALHSHASRPLWKLGTRKVYRQTWASRLLRSPYRGSGGHGHDGVLDGHRTDHLLGPQPAPPLSRDVVIRDTFSDLGGISLQLKDDQRVFDGRALSNNSHAQEEIRTKTCRRLLINDTAHRIGPQRCPRLNPCAAGRISFTKNLHADPRNP